ncbi:MAG: hypothetical protein JST68_10305 [Bacteroidetes bacterium]|nr:hypothetical protein [Bacteroidota bacterium]
MKRLFLIMLFFCCRAVYGQNLAVNDLVGLCRDDIGRVDSIMKVRNFEKKVFQDNDKFTVIGYTFMSADGGVPVMRSVHISKQAGDKYWEELPQGQSNTIYIFSVRLRE